MNKKVLILSNHFITLYSFRKELISQLVLNGFQVYISMPADEKNDYFSDLGCKIITTPLSRHGLNPFEDIKLAILYKSIMQSIQPDIIFSYTIKPNVYGCIVSNMLHIRQICNITGIGSVFSKETLLSKIARFLYRISVKKADKVFFQNIGDRDYFIKHKMVKDNWELIPGSGVNLQHFIPLDYSNDDTIGFVFISRIMKEKGIEQYLEAAKYIRMKYPNTVFHVCGFCEENYKEILKQLTDNGTIIYHGMVMDVREVLKDIHCTIHPTYYPEGLSNVLLESCACARPVITTDRHGCCEVVDNGINGYIVKQKDSQDLINKIERFLALPYQTKREMGLAGRAKVEKYFDRNIIVSKYLKEVKNIHCSDDEIVVLK